MEWIPPDLIAIGGPSALLLTVVLMILRGFLIPRKYLEDAYRDRDEWKTLALQAMQANAKLVESVRVTEQVLKSLPVKDTSL